MTQISKNPKAAAAVLLTFAAGVLVWGRAWKRLGGSLMVCGLAAGAYILRSQSEEKVETTLAAKEGAVEEVTVEKNPAFTVDKLKEGGCNVTANRPLTEADLIKLKKRHEESPIKTLLVCDPNLKINDTKKLLQRFEGLEGFGNRAAHLRSLDELSDYLDLFATNFNDEKPVLRALHIQAELELPSLKPIKKHTHLLYHLFIDSYKIKKADLSDCTSLVDVDLPQVTGAKLNGCTSLVDVTLPKARKAYLNGCTSLVKVNFPKVTKAKLNGCTSLVDVDLHQVTEAYLDGCTSLVKVNFPQAIWAYLNGCTSLVDVDLPQAIWAELDGCTSLVDVDLPQATAVDLSDCTSLVKVNLPQAIWAKLNGCTSLVDVTLPKARKAYLDGCTSLVKVDLPVTADVNPDLYKSLVA